MNLDPATPGPSPQMVCAAVDAARMREGRPADETCLERMLALERLDGPRLWPLRAACMAEAPTSAVVATCNRASHPDWPLPSSAEEPVHAPPRHRDDVGLRFGATLLLVAGAIALGAWARDLGARYRAPRFVRRIALVALAIPLVDVVLAVRSFSSRAGPAEVGWRSVVRSAAPSLALLACASLVMLVLTWRYHWSAPTDESTGRGPYR